MPAESSEVESERLAATRTSGCTRTTSRSPTWTVVEMRMTCRAERAGSLAVASRSVLRTAPVVRSAVAVARMPSARSGEAAKKASPSSAT
jgi:hypothetical protein